jgi:hypothetical protein
MSNALPEENCIQMVTSTARSVHQRICDNFAKVEKTLYEICVDLKSVRDNKYYKELGYDTFELYCLDNFNIKHSQAYKYISIAENISQDSFQSTGKNDDLNYSFRTYVEDTSYSGVRGRSNFDSNFCCYDGKIIKNNLLDYYNFLTKSFNKLLSCNVDDMPMSTKELSRHVSDLMEVASRVSMTMYDLRVRIDSSYQGRLGATEPNYDDDED